MAERESVFYPRLPARAERPARRRLRGAAAALALLCAGLVPAAGSAAAQTYPRKAVTFVVGYAPGGTGDVVARLVAQKLSGALGQPVVVENRAGASGGIAAQAVARAAPDGHTILVGQSAEIAINPHWVRGIAYNPRRDFQPVALGVVVPLGLVVPAKAPHATLGELVAAARASKQGLSFASAGTGTPSQFAGELLKLRTGGNMLHVPYKGAGPALNDILGGHVDFYFPGLPAALGHVRSGQMKLLAVSSAAPSSSAPGVPTVAEAADLPGFDVTLWVGFFAPRGTPAELVARLNGEINTILSDPETRDRLIAEGAEVSPMTVERFTAFAEAESEKYARIIKDTGVKPE